MYTAWFNNKQNIFRVGQSYTMPDIVTKESEAVNDGHPDEEEEEETEMEQNKDKDKKHNSGAADLEKVIMWIQSETKLNTQV